MIRPVAIIALMFAAVAGAQERTMPPAAEQQLARAIYKEMIEVNSGVTTGATTPVAEAVAARLKAAGFPESDIFVGGPTPKKANVVVRYRGTGRRRPILLLAHTDVVEARVPPGVAVPAPKAENDTRSPAASIDAAVALSGSGLPPAGGTLASSVWPLSTSRTKTLR